MSTSTVIEIPYGVRVDGMQGWILPRRVMIALGNRNTCGDLRLICGAGDYELEVLVRNRGESNRLEFAGQVTLSERIYEPAPDVHLGLVAVGTGDPLVETRTDTFGEFDFSYHSGGPYGLRFGNQVDAPRVLIWQGELA